MLQLLTATLTWHPTFFTSYSQFTPLQFTSFSRTSSTSRCRRFTKRFPNLQYTKYHWRNACYRIHNPWNFPELAREERGTSMFQPSTTANVTTTYSVLHFIKHFQVHGSKLLSCYQMFTGCTKRRRQLQATHGMPTTALENRYSYTTFLWHLWVLSSLLDLIR